MFTGIIEEIGTITSIRKGSASSGMVIAASKILEDMRTGDSINTNGVCLTVTGFTKQSFEVDVMPETMLRSAFRELKPGTRVNLERAIRLTGRLGGHLVNGHIDGTGKISRTWKDENAIWFTITADSKLLRYIVEKGSVAIDGISLTVAAAGTRSFDVSLIPFTQSETTLITRKPGESVNIECDIIGKYVEKLASKGGENINLGFLTENGFIE